MWRHQKGNSLLSAVKFILQTRPVGVNKPAHLMPGICVFGSGQRGIRGKKKFKTHRNTQSKRGSILWSRSKISWSICVTFSELYSSEHHTETTHWLQRVGWLVIHRFCAYCCVSPCRLMLQNVSVSASLTFRKIVFKSWGSALLVACT